jgi:hypothetical protein
MLPLLKRDYIDYNVDMVVLYALGARPVPAARFDGYRQALLRLKGRPFLFGGEAPHLMLRFDVEDPVARENLDLLFDERRPPDGVDTSCTREAEKITSRVREAEGLLEAYSASAAAVLRLLIGSILFARFDADDVLGSSHGALLGTIWINPQDGWEGADYAEMILHEGVHQSLFLDEMVNTLFVRPPREMEDESSLVLSPSLGRPRAYDLAFHSSVVVTALADLYSALALPRPPRVEANLARLPVSIAGLRRHDDLLTAHGKGLLGLLEMEVERLSPVFSGVSSSI